MNIIKIAGGLKFRVHNFYRNKLGLLLGYEIPLNVFEEGLHIYHSGSIVVNDTSHIGKNCVIIGSVCIGSKNGGSGPTIGDNCELGINSVIIGDIRIGDNVFVGAGAVVTKNFNENNVSLAGVPAKIVAKR